MAYNFKSIADVEVVAEPAESANVLIEENGVIKKAPKTAVGGAGGEADLVVRIAGSPSIKITADTCSIEAGSVEAVFNAIREGRTPNVKMKFCDKMELIGDTWKIISAVEVCPQVQVYGEYLWMMYSIIVGNYVSKMYYGRLSLNSDSSFNQNDLYQTAVATSVS